MAFAPETIKLLRAAKELVKKIPADAVLILADGPMEWDKVLEELSGTRILVAARHEDDFVRIKDHPDLTLIEIESGPPPPPQTKKQALNQTLR
jgi:diadenylate cyclase